MKELYEYSMRELRGAWRFRWTVLCTAWAIFLIGATVAFILPDVYEANARVFVDTSSRLRDVLGRIAFEPDVESRVALVRQALLGRPQLEKVAQSTGLYGRAATPEEHDKLIERLTLNITVAAARNAANLYTITYQDNDRDMALAVVDKLLHTFVEDVIEQKERGSLAAERFLSQQIQHYSEQLADAEQQLAEFKKRNFGLMPGESGDHFVRLQKETELAETLQANLQVARSRRDEMQRQIDGEKPMLAVDGTLPSLPTPVGATAIQDPTLARIHQLETTLSEYLLRFTDNHPDVVAVKEQIAQLRMQRQREMEALAGSGQTDASLATNPVYQQLRMSLNAADVEIAAITGELNERNRRIADLRELLDTAPEVEAELARLTRNYGSMRSLYDQLQTQLEQERLVNEGDAQNVINFETIDPPQANLFPIGPQRAFILILSLVLALGLGGGLGYLLNQLRPVFFDANVLRNVSGLPVLGEVSVSYDNAQRTRRRYEYLGYALSVGLLMTVFAVAFVLRQPVADVARQYLAQLSGS